MSVVSLKNIKYSIFSPQEKIEYPGEVVDYWKQAGPQWINDLEKQERDIYLALNRKFQDRSNGRLYVPAERTVDACGNLCIVTNLN